MKNKGKQIEYIKQILFKYDKNVEKIYEQINKKIDIVLQIGSIENVNLDAEPYLEIENTRTIQRLKTILCNKE